ncbi:hypothetical protein [Butyrivibrio sp. INlla16]|uniref:hypothetical protein n=1 Tax=Butyrivibrio sp. INlla16 TaxID=1520807 RepID=UPI00088BE7CE|nr:hypothetical protein [Butyrivibrio sp. INlla16]SDB64308.1 hypothetical protein SAMN02910263_03579 [Butyrivibrio sp. INlla16]
MIDKPTDYIFLAILGFFLVRLIWMLVSDFIGMFNYFRASVYSGHIVKSLGTVKEKAYISGHSSYYHTFEKYCVEYNLDGHWQQSDVLTAKRNLHAGDSLTVHVLTHNGIPEIQTDTCGAKIRFITLILLFSVAATAALVFFFG